MTEKTITAEELIGDIHDLTARMRELNAVLDFAARLKARVADECVWSQRGTFNEMIRRELEAMGTNMKEREARVVGRCVKCDGEVFDDEAQAWRSTQKGVMPFLYCEPCATKEIENAAWPVAIDWRVTPIERNR